MTYFVTFEGDFMTNLQTIQPYWNP